LLITSINRGVYRVVEDETIPVRTSVSDDFRAVRLHQWSRDSSLVLVGLRDGLALLRRSGEDWIDEGRVPKLNIDAWYIAEASNGDLWLGSQSSRVARVRLPEKVEGKKIDLKKIEVTVYGPEDGIIEGTLRPFSIDGKIYITGSGETVFSFDEANERFSENPIFNGGRSGHPLGNFNLREDNKGRVWITSTYGAPVIAHPQMDESYTFEVLREFRHKRIIDVYPEPDGVVWLMGEYELIRYDMKNIREAETLPSLLIRQVLLREDILLYGGFGEIEAPQIAYGVGAVRFSYSAPGQSVQPQFRTKMDGFDESWSSWTADSERSYTNLPPGNYSFRVESDGSDESAIFQITVLPPWYRTWWAYGIYFLLIIVILDVARRLVKRRAQLQERKKFELKQAQHSLSEKETLLKEIHHRVKNNLQLVSGILELQASKIDDKKVRDKLHEGQKRLGSMALIHELLYQGDDLGAIDFKEYVLQLTNDIAIAFGNAKKKIEMHVEVNDVRFDVNTAVPLGLIITELITNTYRHAFINKRKGNIYLKLKAIENGDYQLTIQDDGKGMPKGFDYNKVSSLGIRLVNGLTRQLEGSLEIQNGIGTIIIINFKDIHEHE
jgi:two-component sensor histidine kinase